MTDTYTPQGFDSGYGWGAGYPTTWGTAPTSMPSPSVMPAYGSAAVTAANGGVPPGAAAQQQFANLSPQQLQFLNSMFNTAPAQPGAQAQPAQGQLTPQQMQLLQYFLGGRSNTAQGQQALLMQLLAQHRMLGGQQAAA